MKSSSAFIASAVMISLLLAAGGAPGAPRHTPARRLGFRHGDDWEPALAADRFGHVYALWTHFGDNPSCSDCASPQSELQISSDHGRTWSTPVPIAPSDERQDDPQIAVDPVDGRTVYAAYMQGDKSSMYVARSRDFGQTWTPVLVEDLQRGTDKDILVVRGRHVYLAFNAVQKIYASISHDRGKTWATHQIGGNTNSKLGWSLPGGGAIARGGTAYFAWAGFRQSGKPSGQVNLYVSRSTTGGRTWRNFRVDISQAPPDCGDCGWAYWGPQMTLALDRRGTVYVLYNANHKKFGRNRLYFRRSTNRGATWTRRKDVSKSRRGANNLFPAIAARGRGDVRIAWQDDRRGFDSTGADPGARWNTFYRRSWNGGRTWSREVPLSRYVTDYVYKRRRPRPGYLEPYGDYFELVVDGAGRTHVLWGEAPGYDGPGNVWYSRTRR